MVYTHVILLIQCGPHEVSSRSESFIREESVENRWSVAAGKQTHERCVQIDEDDNDVFTNLNRSPIRTSGVWRRRLKTDYSVDVWISPNRQRTLTHRQRKLSEWSNHSSQGSDKYKGELSFHGSEWLGSSPIPDVRSTPLNPNRSHTEPFQTTRSEATCTCWP